MESPNPDQIADALKKVGVTAPCPRCNNAQFILVEGTAAIPGGSSSVGNVNLSQVIPVAVAICNKCGFVAHHALGVLGLLPKPDVPKTEPQENKNEVEK